jgi:nitroreductase
VYAPSGGNVQRLRFLVIKDPAIKEPVEHVETFPANKPVRASIGTSVLGRTALFMNRWFEDAVAKLLGSLERVPATTRGVLVAREAGVFAGASV